MSGTIETVLTFAWETPPLHANQTWPHWAPKAAVTKTVRRTAALMAHKIPPLGRCKVTLSWQVKDNRVRDSDNLYPLLKALCDGLVDAKVVADDKPKLMTKDAPEIVLVRGCVPHFTLRIVQL